jgi:hypothetical protein
MSATTSYLAGVLATAALSALVALTLDRPLRSILVELCGSPARAGFWSALARVVIVGVPLIFALNVQPDTVADVPAALAIAAQLKWSLIGIVTAVVVLGLILAAFVPRPVFAPSAPQVPPQANPPIGRPPAGEGRSS